MEKVRCPRCAEKGQDTRGDNLAIYPDGHRHCYACGYHKGLPVDERIRQLTRKTEVSAENSYNFPQDYNVVIPAIPMNWLKHYGITDQEITKHKFGWSEQEQMLIFPVQDETGELIMWQGRVFDPERTKKHKYFTKGPASDILHLVGTSTGYGDTVVITEDLISAIKVGRSFQALPAWGSNIPLKTILKLSERFASLGIWLDRDKRDEALVTALRASQYMPAYVIASVFDPKEYNNETIAELVESAHVDQIYGDTVTTLPKDAIGKACRRLAYAEARRRYPAQIQNLTDYVKFRNSFDNHAK